MKRQVVGRFMIVSLVALWAGVTAYGQQARTHRVNIPFEFTAWNTTFPAGQYTITPATANSASAALLIRRANGRPQAALCATRAVASRDVQEQSKLVFRRYGHRYFLYQVWREGDQQGHEIRTSRLEQELAKHGVRYSLQEFQP